MKKQFKPRKIHHLKTWSEYYNRVVSGRKLMELRKNDRDYDVDDVLVLQDFNPLTRQFTGDEKAYLVIDVVKDAPNFGLMDGYVIMSIIPYYGDIN